MPQPRLRASGATPPTAPRPGRRSRPAALATPRRSSCRRQRGSSLSQPATGTARPGVLTVRLIDGSNTANNPVAFSASADVSTNGNPDGDQRRHRSAHHRGDGGQRAPRRSSAAARRYRRTTRIPRWRPAPRCRRSWARARSATTTATPTRSRAARPARRPRASPSPANASTAAQGTWQYSINGGATWVDIPTTGLGNTNVIVIPSSATLRFLANGDWNGTPGALTAHIPDGTGGLPATGPRDISANIGTTSQWSSGTITIVLLRRRSTTRRSPAAASACRPINEDTYSWPATVLKPVHADLQRFLARQRTRRLVGQRHGWASPSRPTPRRRRRASGATRPMAARPGRRSRPAASATQQRSSCRRRRCSSSCRWPTGTARRAA